MVSIQSGLERPPPGTEIEHLVTIIISEGSFKNIKRRAYPLTIQGEDKNFLDIWQLCWLTVPVKIDEEPF